MTLEKTETVEFVQNTTAQTGAETNVYSATSANDLIAAYKAAKVLQVKIEQPK
jgi:hypothetical protein